MKILLLIVRIVLSIRYKVKITWERNFEHDWPILILANHVALVDPRILLSFLWKYKNISPLASEKYYNKPVMKQIMDLFWTVPIWEVSSWANPEEVKKSFWKIIEALKNGKNILIYPSGQIYRQWYESIKWKQSVYNIVSLMPENTKVIWVRTRWLWWSLWSMAWDNWETWFWSSYWKSIFYGLANLLFFVPKREVSIKIEDITPKIKTYKKLSLNEFNTYLEHFFNHDWEEKINYIKHFFYYDDVKNKKAPEVISWSEKELNMTKVYDLSKIDEDLKNKIIEKISIIKDMKEKEKIKDNSNLVLDLYFDSLDLAEIKSYIQANFSGSSNPPITDLRTIADLYMMAIWKSENVEELKKCDWNNEDNKYKKASSKLLIDRIL